MSSRFCGVQQAQKLTQLAGPRGLGEMELIVQSMSELCSPLTQTPSSCEASSPQHPASYGDGERGAEPTQRSIARAAQPPSMPAHPGCLGCFGCLRGGADWVLSFSDASPNSHLRQTCFDSVRTLQESCLSSQSEASQLFITSRLRRRLPKPYRSQSLSSLSSLHPTNRTSASASALTIPPLIEPSNLANNRVAT